MENLHVLEKNFDGPNSMRWRGLVFKFEHSSQLSIDPRFIPKLLLRLLRFFRRTAALSRQIRTFPQLFRFCSDLGNSGIRQNVRNSMLTGRWWEGRILINLCGKNNVRNCDLLQSDFFARCRTVLQCTGDKGIFSACGETWKKMRTRNLVIFYAWETCY